MNKMVWIFIRFYFGFSDFYIIFKQKHKIKNDDKSNGFDFFHSENSMCHTFHSTTLKVPELSGFPLNL